MGSLAAPSLFCVLVSKVQSTRELRCRVLSCLILSTFSFAHLDALLLDRLYRQPSSAHCCETRLLLWLSLGFQTLARLSHTHIVQIGVRGHHVHCAWALAFGRLVGIG